jgi:hypothetical protein
MLLYMAEIHISTTLALYPCLATIDLASLVVIDESVALFSF